MTDEPGQPNIYVQPFLRAGGKHRISPNGGRNPHWRADGKELFYIDAEGFMTAVPMNVSDASAAGEPKRLFQTGIGGLLQMYAVTRDGKRFLVNTVPQTAGTSPPLTVIVNWASTLRK
jgi:hypothetical protein